jgi:bile acid:Na+ symporter, BASS family
MCPLPAPRVQVIPAVFVLHSAGFFLGYWASKAVGTTDKVARTNSIEVRARGC